MTLTVIGTTKFILGFTLAGVDTTLADENNVLEKIGELKDEKIVILDGALIDNLTYAEREKLETSVDPVIITLWKDDGPERERLRHTIKNTLGVDLLK